MNLIVPTGNLGNASAALLAKRLGFPLGALCLATNANPTLVEYFSGADYRPRDAIATLANAMDVGAPSNFERLRHWHASDAELRQRIRVEQVDDEHIRAAIRTAPQQHGFTPCPHTATGLVALQRLRERGDTRHWAVAATAHAAKFAEIVTPLVGQTPEPPTALVALATRRSSSLPMPPDAKALRAYLMAD